MSRALALAERGLFSTDPNPRVGCVIVKGGNIIADGWHERAGGPHAETVALENAGLEAKGATAYVTLEPCTHHGRTPPCADALINAGVARVVAATLDPSPEAGGGLEKLATAGIETDRGVCEAESRALNRGFFWRFERGRPHVTIKMAMSLDGHTAMASGESKWISSEAARADVQSLRARSSAILTGIGTVLADDPRLSVRLNGAPRQPMRVVIDRELRCPLAARLLNGDAEVVIFTGAEAAPVSGFEQAHVRVERVDETSGRLNLDAVLQKLATEGVNEVLVEAGPGLCGALIEQKLVDELVIYVAPNLMGDSARGLFHLPGIERLDQRVELDIQDICAIGPDWRITATFEG